MKLPFVAMIAGLSAVTLTGLLVTRWAPAAPDAEASALSEIAIHDELVAYLRELDSPVPERPPVHPALALYNAEAIIPPQCYTRTEGQHNPCYVCHQDEMRGRENRMNDGVLQRQYQFSEVGLKNHWRNLFEDRSERVAAITDEEILAWIGQDNYSELAPRLVEADFKGWIPDLKDLDRGAAAFDEEGFARDGSGWVAFNYKPMPSTFWPTNGSTDDVMIRLAPEMRRRADGTESRDVYRANLAILEATIKGLDEVTTHPIDETLIGVDLDEDGILGEARVVRRTDAYVGEATGWFRQEWLYPLGTEFLHTVRYVGIAEDGTIGPSRRMKEVRYMRKHYVLPHFSLYNAYLEEGYAKEAGYLPGYIDQGPHGLDNEMGWLIQGFIEDRRGRLRASTYEENLFCMGCHTSVGSTIDKVYSFARKVDGASGWGYIELHGMPDAPNRGEPRGEIATYLQRAGGGGEFRSNPEMQARWFDADGRVDLARVAAAPDVYTLITPSRERALELNKAYRVLVDDQDYIYGRDASVVPPANVYRQVDPESVPTLPEERAWRWDIRLDWSGPSGSASR
ncbi:hypothetical protein [Elongatibacter sediminis]|uniref:Lipoprotein n=1 Tax=Elongatibacter sediminis TaxID=3119006 RepID=A0AAW9REM0_9GAMM